MLHVSCLDIHVHLLKQTRIALLVFAFLQQTWLIRNELHALYTVANWTIRLTLYNST